MLCIETSIPLWYGHLHREVIAIEALSAMLVAALSFSTVHKIYEAFSLRQMPRFAGACNPHLWIAARIPNDAMHEQIRSITTSEETIISSKGADVSV